MKPLIWEKDSKKGLTEESLPRGIEVAISQKKEWENEEVDDAFDHGCFRHVRLRWWLERRRKQFKKHYPAAGVIYDIRQQCHQRGSERGHPDHVQRGGGRLDHHHGEYRRRKQQHLQK